MPFSSDPLIETVTFWPKKEATESLTAKQYLTDEQFATVLAFKVPDQVNHYHPSIAVCRKSYRERDKKYALDRYNRITFPPKTSNPGFKVTPEMFDRASLFLQGLISLFQSIGWDFVKAKYTYGDSQYWGFKHRDEILCIEIKEAVTKAEPPEHKKIKKLSATARDLLEPNFSSSYLPHYKSTGHLELSIDVYSPGFKVRWKDSGSELLENQLGAITQGFSRAFEHRRLQTIENEKRRREYEKQEAERKERARLQRIEEKRREHLFSLAESFDKVSKLRLLISTIEGFKQKDQQLVDWLNWARNVVSELDPLGKPERIVDVFDDIEAKESSKFWLY